MSEIGSGSGSSYPGSLDTNTTVETNAPNPGKTKAKAEVVNDLAAAILSVETTLGVNPQGTKATVVARLDQEHNADGSHKDSLIVTVSGQNQNITGRKVFQSGISLGVDGLYGTSVGQITGKTTVGVSGAMWFVDDIRTSGSIHIARNPVANLEVAPKQYVDSSHIKLGVVYNETINATTDSSSIYFENTNSNTITLLITVAGSINDNCSMIAVWRDANGYDHYFSAGKGTMPAEPLPTQPNQVKMRFRNNHSGSQLVTIKYLEIS